MALGANGLKKKPAYPHLAGRGALGAISAVQAAYALVIHRVRVFI